jgi:tol-pal system beta propeller repeat protein TolB
MRMRPALFVMVTCVLLDGAIAAGVRGAGALAPPDSARFYQNVEWSPDGEYIAYSEFAGGEYAPEKWSVFIARRDGSDARLLAPAAGWVAWSPNGAQLAFQSPRSGNPDIYVVDRDGSNVIRVTDEPASDSAPAWSPDGGRIAFTSEREGDADIYVMSASGRDARRLTEGPTHEHNPQWSPDGEYLVFYRSSGLGDDQVWVREVDGAREWNLTDDPANNIFPSYLADGSIAFSTRPVGGEPRLVVVDADGDNRRAIGPAGVFFARWSPDGAAIAFIAGRWPTAAIYVMRADGVGVQKIVN